MIDYWDTRYPLVDRIAAAAVLTARGLEENRGGHSIQLSTGIRNFRAYRDQTWWEAVYYARGLLSQQKRIDDLCAYALNDASKINCLKNEIERVREQRDDLRRTMNALVSEKYRLVVETHRLRGENNRLRME